MKQISRLCQSSGRKSAILCTEKITVNFSITVQWMYLICATLIATCRALASRQKFKCNSFTFINFYSDKYQTLIAQQYLSRFTQPFHAPKLRGKKGPCVEASVETCVRILSIFIFEFEFVLCCNYVTNKLTNFLFALGWIITITSGDVNCNVPFFSSFYFLCLNHSRIYLSRL